MVLVAPVHPRLIQRLPDREQSDDQDHHVDAVEELRDAEREASVAGELVDSDQSDRQAKKETQEPAQHRVAEQGCHRGERQDGQAKVLRRPEAQTNGCQRGREECERDGGEGAGHERADGGGRQRR